MAISATVLYARDFTYSYEGNKITYTVIDEAAKTCMTKAGTSTEAGNQVSGKLTLPAHPMDGDTQYTLTEIGDYSFFEQTKLTGPLTLPATLTKIGKSAFTYCKFMKGGLYLGDSLEEIGEQAFSLCYELNGSLIIPNSVKTIGKEAFQYSRGFTGLTLSRQLTEIEAEVFEGCGGFTGPLVIPNSVTKIGFHAFFACDGFTGPLTIGYSVKEIGGAAFSGCGAASKLVNALPQIPPKGSSSVFSRYEATLCVPMGKIAAYREAPKSCWPLFENIEEKEFGGAGIDSITADIDPERPVEVYDMSGAKVGESIDSLTPGIYIVRQGKASKKIVVK